jgi:acyl-CoA synthetase (AMP-forming)/AMP-acid ligase II
MPHPRQWAAEAPEKSAVVMAGSGTRLSYGALEDRANQIARFLREQGLRRGDALAVLLENRPEFLEVFWGAQRAGLYVVPVSWRLKADEIAYILENSAAKILFTSELHAGVAMEAGRLARLERLVCTGAPPSGFLGYEGALAALPAAPIPDESLGRDMMYSSGTTGRPKGVKTALPDGEITSMMPVMAFMSELYGFDEQTVFLSTSPLYHAAGLRYAMVTGHAGGTLVVMEAFDAPATLALIERYRVTHVSLVPTMFVRMLKLPERVRAAYDLSSLRMVIHGTGPCGRDVKQAMIDWLGPILFENYGATEGNGLCALDSHEWLSHPGSVGKAVVGRVHIIGPDGECPNGEDGLVYFEGGPRFAYHGDPEKTAQAYSPEGYSTLGDIGHLDDEGYLYLTDRQSHMIISGGVNIYPQEVEDILLAHPDVWDAAVIGVPDEEFGEAVLAVVHPVDPAAAGPALAAALIAFCRSRLATFKCPRRIDFATDLPRHETGKIYKRLLKQRYESKQEVLFLQKKNQKNS